MVVAKQKQGRLLVEPKAKKHSQLDIAYSEAETVFIRHMRPETWIIVTLGNRTESPLVYNTVDEDDTFATATGHYHAVSCITVLLTFLVIYLYKI